MRTALVVGMATLAALVVMAGSAPAKMVHHGSATAATAPKSHEAKAAQFERQAKEARALAQKHEEMGNSYKDVSTARAHCEALSANYNKIADEFEGLAKDERELAKGAK